MKSNKFLTFVLTAFIACAMSVGEANAYDGCETGYTKRAFKLAGYSSYASHCRLSECVPLASQAVKTELMCFGLPPVQHCYDRVTVFHYTASPGRARGLSCPADVESAFGI